MVTIKIWIIKLDQNQPNLYKFFMESEYEVYTPKHLLETTRF